MTWQDLVNGSFEVVGGGFAWYNVYCLHRDREVKGVSVAAWAVFAVWAIWNLYYYPHLGQWASFVGGLILAGANVSWLILYLKVKSERREQA